MKSMAVFSSLRLSVSLLTCVRDLRLHLVLLCYIHTYTLSFVDQNVRDSGNDIDR